MNRFGKNIWIKQMMFFVLVMVFVFPFNASAAPHKYQIESKAGLKSALQKLNQTRDTSGAVKLKGKVNPVVLESYLRDLEKEIDTAVANNKKESIQWNPTDTHKSQDTVIPLSDGGKVIVTEEVNTLEPPVAKTVASQPGLISPNVVYFYFNGTKTSYTVTKNVVHVMYPDTKLVLRTFFTVNASNIKIYDSSVSGTTAFYPNVVSGSSSITDTYAAGLGQDANAKGDYDYSINAFGASLYSTHKSIVSSVKWSVTHTSGKDVSLTYSFY